MDSRSPNLVLAVALATLTLLGSALGEESARSGWQQALDDLRTRRDQATEPPVLPHLRNAVSFAEGVEFTDANHVTGSQSLDGLRQATNSATEATRESLRAGNAGLAGALKADCLLLADAARRLANALVADAQAPAFPIDSASAAARDANIAQVATEIARGDALVQEEDNSFRRYNPFVMVRANDAIARYKSAYLAARDATRFRLGLSSVSLSPSLFSPNGDGRRESVRLTAQLLAWDPVANARARVECAVLNAAGATIRTIVQDQPIPAGAGLIQFTATLDWDGRDSAGVVAAEGVHTLRVGGAYLPPGGAADPLNGTLSAQATLDVTPPAVEISVRAYSNNPREPIAGTWSDPNGVVPGTARILVDGEDVTASAQLTATTFSFTPASDWAEGTRTISVRVSDPAGNAVEATASFIEDRTAPSLSNPRPGDSSYVLDGRPTIGLDLSEALSGISAVQLFVRGVDVTAQTQVTATSISYTPVDSLSDGQVDVRAVAADGALNVAELVWIFRLDTTLPEWRDVRPEVITTQNRRELFDAIPVDGGSGVDVASIRVRLDGADVTSAAEVSADRVTFTPPENLTLGAHSYEADLADTAGNAAVLLRLDFEVFDAVAQVNRAEGGTATVTDPESPIYNASVAIPPGAIGDSDTLTLTYVPEPLAFPEGEAVPAGPTIDVNLANGAFLLADATLRVPYDPAAFSAAGVPEEAALLFVLEDGTDTWIEIESAVNATGDFVEAQRSAFSQFRVAFRIADPDRSRVNITPSRIEVSRNGLVVVTPLTAGGAIVGRGHAVSARIVSGGGTIVLPFSYQLDGSYAATLSAPSTSGPVEVEGSVDGRILTQRATAEYFGGTARSFTLSPAPPSTTAGDVFSMMLSALDQFGNLATEHRGSATFTEFTDIRMQVNGGDPSLGLTFTGVTPGRVQFTVSYLSTGQHAFRLEDAASGLFAVSSVTRVDAGAPDDLLIVGGDDQVGTAGTRLQQGLRVQAVDALLNGVGGVSIAFEVTGGTGGISELPELSSNRGPIPVTTDSSGEAEVFLTLGPDPAVLNRVTATIDGTTIAPKEFTAVGRAPGTADYIEMTGDVEAPAGVEVQLTITLTLGTQGVSGEANNIVVSPESSTVPVSFSVITDQGEGIYTVGVLPEGAGDVSLRATWTPGPLVTQIARSISWFDADTMTVTGPTSPVAPGDDARVTIYLADGTRAVPRQSQALTVRLLSGGDPDAFTIGDVSEIGNGFYEVTIVSAIAADPARFEVAYDWPTPAGSPDLGAEFDVRFVVPQRTGIPPKVISVVPADDATNVPLDAAVEVVFDRVMDTRTVTTTNLGVFLQGAPLDFAQLWWLRVPKDDYNAANGESRIACGDIDGDGRDEIVVGLGPYPQDGGWVAVFDDAVADPTAVNGIRFPFIGWIQFPWTAYNAANGEIRPAIGDVDGDGRAEILLGMGPYANGGYVAAFEHYRDTGGRHRFRFLQWIRVPWSAYNSSIGATRPAVGDFDGDGRGELAIGLDRPAGMGSDTIPGGYIAILDDAPRSYRFMGWKRVPWPAYNSANGETRPCAGDVDGDGRDEILVSLGRYPANGGWSVLFDDASTSFVARRWTRLHPFATYNAANGETWSSMGDIDGDGVDEVVLGMGSYPNNGGWIQVKDDYSTVFRHVRWLRVPWAPYNAANGETRPSLGNVIAGTGADGAPPRPIPGDSKEEILVGLGTYPPSGGWVEIRGPNGNIAGTINFETRSIDGVQRTVAVFRPEQQFLPNETYEVRVSGILDLDRNMFDQIASTVALDPFVSTFQTALTDEAPPSVSSVDPPDGANNVSTYSDVTAQFSEPVVRSTIPGAFWVEREDGTPAGGGMLLFDGEQSQTGTCRSVSISRGSTQWAEGFAYRIVLTSAITDTAGNNLIPFSSIFRVLNPYKPPPPIITSPPPPSPTQRWRALSLQFVGVAEPGGTIEFANLTDGVGEPPLATATVAWTGYFNVRVPGPGQVFAEGEHRIRARVRSPVNNFWSDWSPTVTFTIDNAAPDAVRGLTAVAGPAGVDLAWQANAESDLLGYLIYRRRTGEAVFSLINPVDLNDTARRRLPITGTKFLDSNVQSGQEYSYRVYAADIAEPEQPQSAYETR